jgi:hypothetical protein
MWGNPSFLIPMRSVPPGTTIRDRSRYKLRWQGTFIELMYVCIEFDTRSLKFLGWYAGAHTFIFCSTLRLQRLVDRVVDWLDDVLRHHMHRFQW